MRFQINIHQDVNKPNILQADIFLLLLPNLLQQTRFLIPNYCSQPSKFNYPSKNKDWRNRLLSIKIRWILQTAGFILVLKSETTKVETPVEGSQYV